MRVESKSLVAHQVPEHHEMPSEEMIQWLGACPHEWNGDECGVTIQIGECEVVAAPGDWIVSVLGQWFVLPASEGGALYLILCQMQATATRRMAETIRRQVEAAGVRKH